MDPAGLSTRALTDEVTGVPQCAGCHAVINPLGYALGEFDVIGRYAPTERIFDETGGLEGEYPVDARVEAAIDQRGEAAIDGAVELSLAIGQSIKAHECFAIQLFRFSLGRHETSQDGCYLWDLSHALLEDQGSIRDALLALVTHESFRMRRIEP